MCSICLPGRKRTQGLACCPSRSSNWQFEALIFDNRASISARTAGGVGAAFVLKEMKLRRLAASMRKGPGFVMGIEVFAGE